MLKIGKNWGKIANYPPNAQHKLAPLALGINLVARDSPFLPYFKNIKQRKLLITTYLLVRENLKDIANRSDSIGKALISNT